MEARSVLDARELDAIRELEHRVVAADGGRLKLEWGVLRDATAAVEDSRLLWWDAGVLIGFAGCYAFGGSPPEVAGMVDPRRRRRGIGTALLARMRSVVAAGGHDGLLLVTARSAGGGAAFAAARGGRPDHSEHFMVLGPRVHAAPERSGIGVRAAIPADLPARAAITEAAFGHPAHAEVLDDQTRRVLTVTLDGRVVGALRVSIEGQTVGIYGFAIDPSQQGRGIGRDVLGRVCHRIREEDPRRRVTLEVAVDNDRALGLYESVGFTREATEDYFALPAR